MRAIYIILILIFALPSFGNEFSKNDNNDLIKQQIIIALQQRFADENLDFDIAINSEMQLRELSNNIHLLDEVKLIDLNSRFNSFNVQVTSTNDKKYLLSGRYVIYKNFPVAAKYIKFNQVIQDQDIKLSRMKLDSKTAHFIDQSSQIIGKKAKKYISPGSFFRENELSSVPVIKTGDPVNLVYAASNINLKTNGIAMGSGAIGHMIKVKNATSGTVMLGEIINNNTVRIGGKKDDLK